MSTRPSTTSFTELRLRLKKAFDEKKWTERNLACDLIANLGSRYVRGLPEEDFMQCLQMGDAKKIANCLAASIMAFVAQEVPCPSNGVLVEFIQAGLMVMIPHWFQNQADPYQTDGWTIPTSVIINCAISARLKRINEATRQREFYAKLGKPSAPLEGDAKLTRSPTGSLEQLTDLPPDVKANVLRNSLEARNREGITTPDGIFRTEFLKYHARSLEAARRVFEANPSLTPSDLTGIVDACCMILEQPLPSNREDDNKLHLRKCFNLSYMLLMLRKVLKEYTVEMPVEQFLTKRQLFGDGSDDVEASDRPPLTG